MKTSNKNLKNLKNKNPENILLSYININSIRYKLDDLVTFLDSSIDILNIAETKLDSYFPTNNFLIDGFKKPYRLDISDLSGGLLSYIRSDIPSRLLRKDEEHQILFIELNFRKQKWLLCVLYRHHSIKIDIYLSHLSNVLDMYSSSYENFLIIGDFNEEPTSESMTAFFSSQNLYCHIKQNTCYKSPEGTCIDLILSNKILSFQHTGAIETGISDHHSMIYTMFKTKFQKAKPKIIKYRDYKRFNSSSFLNDVNIYLPTLSTNFSNFQEVFEEIIERHAPLKTKFLRANNKPHVTKLLRKAIMKRSQLKALANKTKNESDKANYRRQRNLVVNMNRKVKKSYIASLNPAKGTSFWKAINTIFRQR